MDENAVVLQVVLTKNEAEAYANFLKRIGFDDYRQFSFNAEEAYIMQDAGRIIEKELKYHGYNPR